MAVLTVFLNIASGPVLDWMPGVTLLFLLSWQPWVHFSKSGSLADVPSKLLVAGIVLALMVPELSRSPWLWAALTVGHFAWIASAYHAADNHQYLIGYWCMSIAIALWVGGSGEVDLLARMAPMLIGLCFALALIAKASSPRYRDGSMFGYLMLLDWRFMPIAAVCGGVSPALRERHAIANNKVRRGEAQELSIPTTRRFRVVARILTWWTLVVEASVAALFLWPSADLVEARIVALLLFAIPTYILVAVPAFGQILLLLLAATTPDPAQRAGLILFAVSLSVMAFIPQHLTRLAIGRHRLYLRGDWNVTADHNTASGSVVRP